MARDLKAKRSFETLNLGTMIAKESLHLGQEVGYLGERGIVDALTQSTVALVVNGRYIITGWENVEA